MTAHSPIRPDPIAAFMPWSKPEERDLRRRVLCFQQRASTRAKQSGSARARSLWWLIVDIAAENALTSAPPGRLDEVLILLTRTALCAGALELWETPDSASTGSTGQ